MVLSVTLPDGCVKEVQEGVSLEEFAGRIGKRLASDSIAGKINGTPVDLNHIITKNAPVELLTAASAEGTQILRHSAAHIMAQAVQDLFPGTKLGIGPAIEDGFYYDFDTPKPFTDEDIGRIEKRMREIVAQDIPFVRQELGRDEAVEFFRERGESYKEELISAADGEISLYRQGDFVDLCRGPHLPSTGKLKVFKLLSVAGAYWRGDENNKMLQRIYGTAFADKESLKKHLQRLEEARKRDHRKLGKELDLFSFHEEAGAGLVIYHPKGTLIRWQLEDYERKLHLKHHYQPVMGPQLLKLDLWKKSGHYENYRENMYFTNIEDQQYGIKPMNCLAHMLIYKSNNRSYRDLPIRYFELGNVYRHEKSGVLHGLLRVRGFTQDDAHILCRPDQLNDEIVGVMELVTEAMGVFGFSYDLEISTRPEKSIGTDQDWERAEEALKNALEGQGLSCKINEADGAFYGPKIDVKIRDAIGRSWQCGTIQCDFTLPERFDLSYVGEDGAKHRPVMLHRVIFGSLDRFLGVLIEHFAGAFPLWLAPVQVKVMTITDDHAPYAKQIADQLRERNIRVEEDFRNEKIGYKIRQAQKEKTPYMVVVGEREVAQNQVAVRERKIGDLGAMECEDFYSRLEEEIDKKAL
jgi:threonyl-tRNA synthetase